jgi:hypothetical protein
VSESEETQISKGVNAGYIKCNGFLRLDLKRLTYLGLLDLLSRLMYSACAFLGT